MNLSQTWAQSVAQEGSWEQGLGTGRAGRSHSWSCCCLHLCPAVLLGAKLLCPILSTCPSTSCSPSLPPLLFHSVHQRWCWQLLTPAWGIFHSSSKQPFLQNILARLSNCPNEINKPALQSKHFRSVLQLLIRCKGVPLPAPAEPPALRHATCPKTAQQQQNCPEAQTQGI